MLNEVIMIKYAKVINEETKECQVGLGTNEDYYISKGFTQMDVEQAYTGGWYVAGHAPQKPHREVILEQIGTLENSITKRNLRAAIQGDAFALKKINEVEEQIEELRNQLD
jgi:hypothetical protein